MPPYPNSQALKAPPPSKKSVSSSNKPRSSKKNLKKLWKTSRSSKGEPCKKRVTGWSLRKTSCRSRTGWIIRWGICARRLKRSFGRSSTSGKTPCGPSFRTSHSISHSSIRSSGMLVLRRTQPYISYAKSSLCWRCKWLNCIHSFILHMGWNPKMKEGTKNRIRKMKW